MPARSCGRSSCSSRSIGCWSPRSRSRSRSTAAPSTFRSSISSRRLTPGTSCCLQNNTLGPYLNSIVVALSSTVLALLIGSLAAYALVRIRFQVKLAADRDLPRASGRGDRRGRGAACALAGRRRGRDRALPACARHVRAALQGGGRQQRHRVLDDLEPDHAADRRRAADLCDVPASPAARHADSR